jgi:hypothetical protein
MRLMIEQGDNVYNLKDNRKGVVQSIYRELNLSIVKFDNSTEKVALDNLVLINQDEKSGENEDKSINLISKVKKFIHRLKR